MATFENLSRERLVPPTIKAAMADGIFIDPKIALERAAFGDDLDIVWAGVGHGVHQWA